MQINLGNVADAYFYDTRTGERLAELKGFEINTDTHVVEDGIKFTPRLHGTLELHDVKLHKNFVDLLTDPDPIFTLTMESSVINKLTNIMNRTKNKRIKKKLQKRINKLDHWMFHTPVSIKRSQIVGL